MTTPLTGTIEVHETCRFQLIYSSQAYGTHFNIFARFRVEDKLIKIADFKLVNYQGPLNLGIVSIDDVEIIDRTNKYFVLTFDIQALPDSILNQEYTFKPALDLDTERDNYLIIRKNLKKLTEGRQLYTNVVTGDTSLDIETTYRDVFDTEFYHRDGISLDSFNEVNRLPQMNMEEIIQDLEDNDCIHDQAEGKTINFSKEGQSNPTKMTGGLRCMYSANKLIM